MNAIYITGGFIVHPHRHVIEQENNIVQVRPKTFALLLLLLEKPREVLSKRYLLETVWDDVTVDEPVLVQSIRELRQLFANADVIQTYPRKGYSWILDVQKQIVDEQFSVIPQSPLIDEPDSLITVNSNQPRSLPSSWFARVHPAYWIMSSISIVLALIVGLFAYHKITSTAALHSQTDVVIVLPVKNQIFGNDHDWVYLGAMDQLIMSLASDKQVQVMGIEYVLNLMQLAKIPRLYSSEQVVHIFGVSGATLVVESQLSGSVEEYQLEYKLHFKNDIKRGVIFDKNLNDALHKLSIIIAGYTGQSLNAMLISQNAFSNELLARALEKFSAEDFMGARSLLTSLKQLEPDNMIARELLAKALLKSNELLLAKEEINSALALSKSSKKPESAILYSYLAMANIFQGAPDEALLQLTKSDQFASQYNDILYQAYNAQMRGSILQQRGDFESARQSFESALKFHGIIRCPVGLALTHIDLVKLFSAEHKNDLATVHFLAAKDLIETHKLDKLKAQLDASKPSES